MYFGVTEFGFIFYSLIFCLAVFISWWIPGWLVLQSLKIKDLIIKSILAGPIGVAMWGIQAYVFGFAQIRFLTFAYLAFCLLLFITRERVTFLRLLPQLSHSVKSQPIWLWLTFLGSITIQVFAHIISGFKDTESLKFYFVNSVDGIMHLGYIQSLIKIFPPIEPGAIGMSLLNYHYWSDLILADLARVWQLPVIHLFFQFTPLIFAIWTTLLLVKLIRVLGGNHKTVLVALFLLTFGSDAAYIFTQLLHRNWADSVSSLDSGVTFFFNFPQVLARMIFFAVCHLLLVWWKDRRLATGVVAGLLIATLFGLKVYYGLYAVAGLGFLFSFQTLETFFSSLNSLNFRAALKRTFQHHWQAVAITIFISIVALVIYLPTNKNAGGLVYSPLEWPRLFLSADNIDFQDWALRMQVYKTFNNTRNILILNMVAIAMTFVAVYGTRILGLLPLTFKSQNGKLPYQLLIFFIPTNLLFILIGLFTLQTSGGLNIYNFLIVPIVSFNLFAAFNLGRLPTKVFIPVFLIVCTLTLPRPFFQLQHFVRTFQLQKADLILSNNELEALSFLRDETSESEIVQTPLTNKHDQLTPYIAFMSQRSSYMAGTMVLDSHNQPTESREQQLKAALETSIFSDKKKALRELGINYLYLKPAEYLNSGFDASQVVFQNQDAVIVEIK